MSFNSTTNTDFNKISKYTIRMKKSFKNNKTNKTKEYYEHLKYHIQIGGTLTDIEDKFKILDNLINTLSDNSKGYKTFDDLHKDLSKCNSDKTNLQSTITELTTKIDTLEEKMKETADSVSKVDKIKNKEEEEIKKLNEEITTLNTKINEFKQQVDKLTETNTNESKELTNLNLMLDNIYKITEIVSGTIDEKNEKLLEKIKKYQEITTTIKKQLLEIDLSDKEKFQTALTEIETRLKDSQSLHEQLDIANLSIENLTKQLDEARTTSSDLEQSQRKIKELEISFQSKNLEIESLKNKITSMETEKKTNDEKLNKLSADFNNKLSNLLTTIYGNSKIVQDILKGDKFNEMESIN